MGWSMSRDIDRGAMAEGVTVVTHKFIGTEISKVSTFDLKQTKILKSSSFSNREHHCSTLPCQNRGNRQPNVTEIKQRNLAVSLETPDHSYCRIPSKFFECGGRLAVSKQQGHFKIETLSKSISTSIINYPSILLGNPALSVRGQMAYNNRFREINSFMHFPHFDLFYKRWRKWVTTKQKKCCLLVTPTWQSQIWHPLLLQMFIVHPLQIPRNTSLKNSLG